MAEPRHPVDRHVGDRIRLRRMLLGLSQERVAEPLGISYQQLRKYEHGEDRVAASRLYDLACLMGVRVGWFFEQMPAGTAGMLPICPGFPERAPDLRDALTSPEREDAP